jgi:CelD/BcsL family acetyltransferase involved in cellulose biosynthesis
MTNETLREAVNFGRGGARAAAGIEAHAARRTQGESRLGRVEVHADPQGALAAWAELEALAPGSLYQTRRWLLPWIATAGRAAGIEALLVVGYRDDLPVVFCPFGLARRGGLRVASFLGAKDSNANLALIRPGAELSRADLLALFAAAADRAGARPDLFLLSNQPDQWEGIGNPLVALLPHQPSPSYCHRGDLVPQFDAFLRTHLSADGRKNLRRKEKRLAEIGPIAHVRAKTAEDVSRILDAFLAQKRQRLVEIGAAGGFDDASSRAFLEAAATEGLAAEHAAIELHALTVGVRIVATFGGGTHRGRFHGMINSFDLDPDVARASPGEVLLARIAEEKCREGLTSFDLGIGEARYKETWCDAAEPLFDTILPMTMKGRTAAFGESMRLRMKRLVKQTGWAWKIARKLRAR